MLKKSEQYKKAQLAVINSTEIEASEKLEIIGTLISCEELELYLEKEAQKKEAEKEAEKRVQENYA